jgi:hypothetical protein
MRQTLRRLIEGRCLTLGLAIASVLVASITTAQGTRPSRIALNSAPQHWTDPVLFWNGVMLQANANDFDPAVVSSPDQPGPTHTSRAFAIVHAAIYDAVNSIDHSGEPYLIELQFNHDASLSAAVAVAGYRTLVSLYPTQKPMFDQALAQSMAGINPSRAALGELVGTATAQAILLDRANDGSAFGDRAYTPLNLPGYHQPDPLHITQGFLGAGWGRVQPFAIASAAQYRAGNFVGTDPASRLAWLNSQPYTTAFNEVKALGSKNSQVRTADQTEIGIFWSYDGSPRLGTPPRLYNQIARVVAANMKTSVVDNARLFALINLAMADAAIAAWDSKYVYQHWRPIVGIRNAALDGNAQTTADPAWAPLGAQADNGGGTNFTPAFPSYISGHATIGGAMFQVLRRYFGRDDMIFSFQSDEFNGVTKDQNGVVRPTRTRTYQTLTAAEQENHDSRIYLGVHWRFDQDQGTAVGDAVGNDVFDRTLKLR